MKSLALDTSSDILSLALFEEGQLIEELTSNVSKQHGEFLLPLVKTMLDSVSWDIQEIDRIWLGKGPGSYTGLRIGATMAKVWASTNHCQLESFSSLAIMAAQIPIVDGETWIIPVTDARRGTAYTGVYHYEDKSFKNQLQDGHVEWKSWVETQLIPQMKQAAVKEVVLVIAKDSELVLQFQKLLSKEAIPVSVVTGQYAWPKVGKVLLVERERVSDVDIFEPFYAHLTLAEQEWAAKHSKEIKEKKESYVEQINETSI